MEWYFNNPRLLHRLAPSSRALVAMGTTSNEAFHSEINRWCRSQGDVYSTTVELQLAFGDLAKMSSHTSALYRPSLRQIRPSYLLSRLVCCISRNTSSWRSYCTELRQESERVSSAAFPFAKERQGLRHLVRT